MTQTNLVQPAIVALLREHLAQNGNLRFRVLGACMRPVIEAEDEVFLQAATPAQLRQGDIVLFEQGGEFFTHRLVARPSFVDDTWQFQTRGDRAWQLDHAWRAEHFVGRVVRVYKTNERVIELTKGFWPLINQGLGFASRVELVIFSFARALRQRWFGSRPIPGSRLFRGLIEMPKRVFARLIHLVSVVLEN